MPQLLTRDSAIPVDTNISKVCVVCCKQAGLMFQPNAGWMVPENNDWEGHRLWQKWQLSELGVSRLRAVL
jgi:hypothetical protein